MAVNAKNGFILPESRFNGYTDLYGQVEKLNMLFHVHPALNVNCFRINICDFNPGIGFNKVDNA